MRAAGVWRLSRCCQYMCGLEQVEFAVDFERNDRGGVFAVGLGLTHHAHAVGAGIRQFGHVGSWVAAVGVDPGLDRVLHRVEVGGAPAAAGFLAMPPFKGAESSAAPWKGMTATGCFGLHVRVPMGPATGTMAPK